MRTDLAVNKDVARTSSDSDSDLIISFESIATARRSGSHTL
jgi:hypothetical protein